ncbi:MAG: thiamine-phosphate kinase [Deltaproteobacteria bacterium]
MAVHAGSLETVLVDRLARRFKPRRAGVVMGIGDDAAVLERDKRSYWLLTADMLVASVHFREDEDPRRIGYKALAVSVSDIAAMGGEPRYALVSVGIPPSRAERTAGGLMEGLARAARAFKVDIIGGDTVRSRRLVIDVSMVGVVERRCLVLRSGGRPGDVLFVSGPLGGAGRGRHLDFVPRLEAARFLVKNFKVHAMMDLSDGLAQDLERLTRSSRCGAVLTASDIPVHPQGRGLRSALYDGEDFELLFAMPVPEAGRLERWVRTKRAPQLFYPVGRLDRRVRGVWLEDGRERRRRLKAGGFSHF